MVTKLARKPTDFSTTESGRDRVDQAATFDAPCVSSQWHDRPSHHFGPYRRRLRVLSRWSTRCWARSSAASMHSPPDWTSSHAKKAPRW